MEDLFALTDSVGLSRDEVENYVINSDDLICSIIDGKVSGFSIKNYGQIVRFFFSLTTFLNADTEIAREVYNSNDFYTFFSKLYPQSVVVNGEIDSSVRQGSEGDCWLISGLLSLSSTEIGREIIKQSVNFNLDGTVDVYFAGLGLSYRVTKQEIENEHSSGDRDLKIFEAAIRKLRDDLYNGIINLPENIGDDESVIYPGITTGNQSQLWFYLTGVQTEEYFAGKFISGKRKNETGVSEAVMKSIFNRYLQNGGFLSFSLCIEKGKATNVYTCPAIVNGVYQDAFRYTGGAHGFAITEITENTLTFVYPHDSSIAYTVTWDDFIAMGIEEISYLPLTEQNSPAISKEVYDNEVLNLQIYFQLLGSEVDFEDYKKYSPINENKLLLESLYNRVHGHIDFNQDIQSLYNLAKTIISSCKSFSQFLDKYYSEFGDIGLSSQNLRTIFVIAARPFALADARSLAPNYKSGGHYESFKATIEGRYPGVLTEEEIREIYNNAKPRPPVTPPQPRP